MLMRVLRPPVVKLKMPVGGFTAFKHGNAEGTPLIIYSLGTTPVRSLKLITIILFDCCYREISKMSQVNCTYKDSSPKNYNQNLNL